MSGSGQVGTHKGELAACIPTPEDLLHASVNLLPTTRTGGVLLKPTDRQTTHITTATADILLE